ncbi:hypothetical protein D3C83_14970 [compost metagenome]
MGRLRLLEIGQADGAPVVQLLHPCQLLPRQGQVGFARRALRFDHADGRLLTFGVDLHQRLAGAHAITGGDEDLAHVPVDLRLHGGRAQRADRGDELRRLRDGMRRENDRVDAGRRRRRRGPVRRSGGSAAGGGQEDRHEENG